MKRRLPVLAFALIAAGVQMGTSASVHAQAAGPAAGDETPSRWFVELSGPPTADGGDKASVLLEQKAFRGEAKKAGVAFTERYSYQSLFNGMSVRVARGDVAKLQRIAGVKRIYPVVPVSLPPTQVSEPDLYAAVTMTGANIAQNELGLHGDGVTVAVMDTGIDYLHPDLGGCFGPGCRVEKGYDLVGDAYDEGTNPVPVPDPDPLDCTTGGGGHGTHVAGIVGANGNPETGGVVGVAPHVKFHAYRVFGCQGSTSDDVMLAAMEMVLADGADVLNMSIGSAFDDWSESPTAAGSDRLVRKGIVVVASAGNSGASGTYSTGSPSTGTKVISVASYENLSVKLPSFTIAPDGTAIGYIGAAGTSAATPTSGNATIQATATLLGCSAQAPGSLAGKVALIKRGTCSFNVKAINAQNAGAIGVILYNNVAAVVNATVAGPPQVTIPVVGISLADGTTIASRLGAGTLGMTWTSDLTISPNPTAGLVSTFSSLGPTAELDFKPDLGAPGGQIYSTWPYPAPGGYATLSGTSMASPHVAGAVALLLEARPHTPPALVRDLLQNSAVPAAWNGNPNLGFLDNVHKQGAGMIHIDRTVLAPTSIQPAKLPLGEGAAGPATRTLTLSNSSDGDLTYALSHAGALTTGPSEFTISELNAPAAVSFSAPAVTVPAHGSATVDVTITPPTSASLYTYGGYLVATPQGGGLTLRVPYMGVTGNYQDVKVYGTTGLPQLLHADGTFTSNVFNLTAGDLPYFFVQLAHSARTLSLEIYSANADGSLGQSWHRAFQFERLGRNSTATSFYAIPFDGVTTNGNKLYTLPPGSYVGVLSALKPLGDGTNPADSEVYTTPVFVLAR